MKAVAYISQYVFNQYPEVSTYDQLQAIKVYAHSRNIELLQLYQDNFRDRIRDQRPNFLRMMDDTDTGKFDAVLVFDRKNISRDDYQVQWCEENLSAHNISLIAVNDPIQDAVDDLSFIDEIILNI